MLKLNVNQEKELKFDVEIGGVQTEQLNGYLRINIDKVQYGFPANIGNETVTVNLPPLSSVITKSSLKEGKEVDVRLEIVADGNYLVAWEDTFKLINPFTIEAKIIDEDNSFKGKPKLKTKLIEEETEDKDDTESSDDNNDLEERIFSKLSRKVGNVKVKNRPLAESKKEKKITTKDVLNIDKAGIYAYMERAGTKTTQIQDIIYEQAKAAAGSSKPVKILKEVVKILKKE